MRLFLPPASPTTSFTKGEFGLTPEEEKKLWRKVDLRINAHPDGNIGNAKLQGLTTELHLDGNKYNIALIMYFIVSGTHVSKPKCRCECPANLVLKQFKPSRWLPWISMGFVHSFAQLTGVRVCLGVAEAGLFPGVAFYFDFELYFVLYPTNLFRAASVAGAFSGLLAYGISFMHNVRGYQSWRWIFILEGLATVVVGFIAFLVMYDYPTTAKFLTEKEKEYIIRKKMADSGVKEEEGFSSKFIVQAFTDWQVSVIAPLYGITLFAPSIINSFGYSTPISQLLTVLVLLELFYVLSLTPRFCKAIVLFIFANLSDRYKLRSPFILAGLTCCLIGFTINISNATHGAKYVGVFFVVTGAYSAFPGVVSWLGNNLAGQYKRAVGMACHIGIGNFSGAIASSIYRTQDSPRYRLGRKFFKRDQLERERLDSGEKIDREEEMQRLGDKALHFRYTL
ncbi:MFS general substrate transporter [Flagelloscypha sp. PMI_526]|nr:MFS general substrate transporter [Flagelloscypha sp. PMI_526]